jgi:hypothetical protein
MGVVVFPLLFCGLDEVGQICRVIWEGNDWLLELANGQHSKQTIKLQAVCDVFGDGFDVEVKRGRGLGGPCVVKDDVLKALRRCRERCFLGSEGLVVVETQGSFDIDICFSVSRLGSCHRIFDGCLLNESESKDVPYS